MEKRKKRAPNKSLGTFFRVFKNMAVEVEK